MADATFCVGSTRRASPHGSQPPPPRKGNPLGHNPLPQAHQADVFRLQPHVLGPVVLDHGPHHHLGALAAGEVRDELRVRLRVWRSGEGKVCKRKLMKVLVQGGGHYLACFPYWLRLGVRCGQALGGGRRALLSHNKHDRHLPLESSTRRRRAAYSGPALPWCAHAKGLRRPATGGAHKLAGQHGRRPPLLQPTDSKGTQNNKACLLY